jgi:hypothetical protein
MTDAISNQLKSAAVVIGIDNYTNQPLSSSVNDALAFQKSLLELGLVKQEDITLLVAPQGGAGDDADITKIKSALFPFYNDPSRYERLFFFFAGHGISTYTDEARNAIRPVLLAQDVQDLIRDGSRMLDFLELRTLLRGSGPQEQLFFIDACRDLKFEEEPAVGRLGWGRRGNLPPANNRQATLYAVASLGKAQAVKGEQGVMTSHLLAALRSDKLAVDYDVSEYWKISMQSLAEYVRDQVKLVVKDQPLWTQKYNLPELDAPDPQVSPLRSWVKPTTASLVVNITPDQAADDTVVTVYLRDEKLSDKSLPPHRNHAILDLRPQHYHLQASSKAGVITPESQTVDVRRQSEVTFQVSKVTPLEQTRLPVSEGGGPAYPEIILHSCPTCGGLGRISATAQEEYTRVEVNGLESPYVMHTALRGMRVDLPAGPYRISFRLGDQVFSQGDVYLMSNQEAVVKPRISYTPLVGEALNVRNHLPETVIISESLGDLQAGLRDIILPMIGLKPFDQNDQFFGQFYDVVDKAPRNPTGKTWLSVVVAVDGNEWRGDPLEVLDNIRLEMYDSFGKSKPRPVPLQFLHKATLGGHYSSGLGLERVRLGLLPVRSNSFRLVMKAERFGNYEFAMAAGAQRVTVLTLTLQPDGRLLISQSLMRYPGRDQLYIKRGEPLGDPSMSRLVRRVQLTQDLYRSGDLTEAGWDLLDDIANTKFFELSASCLAFYAWQERLQQKGQDEPYVREKWYIIANNLYRYFGELPDPQIIYGQAYPEQVPAIYPRLLESNQVPILAESARRLARFASEHGFNRAAVMRWARRIPVGQIWTMHDQ